MPPCAFHTDTGRCLCHFSNQVELQARPALWIWFQPITRVDQFFADLSRLLPIEHSVENHFLLHHTIQISPLDQGAKSPFIRGVPCSGRHPDPTTNTQPSVPVQTLQSIIRQSKLHPASLSQLCHPATNI